MSARSDLLAYLLERAGVIAVFGDRLAWDQMDQGTVRPYGVLRGLKQGLTTHMTGVSSLQDDQFEVYVVAATPLSREAGKAAIDAELRDLGPGRMGSTRRRLVRRADEGPDEDFARDAGGKLRDFQGRLEYRMWFFA